MEYIILQPLESAEASKNISLVERKNEITEYEQSLILHESGGPFAGFIVKKAMPLNVQTRLIQLTKCDLSFKLKVLMKNANQPMFQEVDYLLMKREIESQVNRINMGLNLIFLRRFGCLSFGLQRHHTRIE